MAKAESGGQPFNILIVAQKGRLEVEALLFAASLRRFSPGFAGRLIVAEPQPGGKWPGDPRLPEPVRAELETMGAEVLPFTARAFGASYPQGNKIEALALLPPGQPFFFFDTDTLVLGELSGFSAARASASMRREGTWPVEDTYWPGYTAVWRSLYDRFGLDFESTLDLGWPDEYWRRYLYFNAGWFCGPDPVPFHARMLQWAVSVRDDPPPELLCQPLDPWLDQVVLPLVIHALGGGRPGPELAGLDGDLTCHYRLFPLLYARESDAAVAALEAVVAPNRIKKLVKGHEPLQHMVLHGHGARARALFDRERLPREERQIRQKLKKEGLWER